ncbi:transglycosylase SLT domain-containing protein [Halomonas sp.]|uniref:transglycosylase SLT domain-containing protein n=1 Tax=Halomonas sp. TaxID=1486246 RepID=UPI003565FFAF
MQPRCLARRVGFLLTALALSLPLGATQAQTHDRALQDALQAARNKEWHKIDQSAIDGHILAGYVDYHRLRDQLPQVEPGRIHAFIQRHRDSPLAEWMRGQAISRYGDAGRYQSLLAVADGVPDGAERQCHYYTALLGPDPQQAASGGRDLWNVGHSQPTACDSLFNTLRAQGNIGEDEIWERQMLAWQAGETGLAGYLGRLLGSRWENGRAAMELLQRDFSAITRIPRCIGPECRGSSSLLAAAMHGFTRADTEAALEAWRTLEPGLVIDPDHREAIEHDLAFYSMVRDIRHHRGWVDEALPRLADDDLLELRIRGALAERDWEDVIHWMSQLSPDNRDDSRWQYWLARAREQLGQDAQAREAYARAAADRSFFGFAAADRLGQPYALNLERNGIDDQTRARVARWPVVERTEALLRIDEPGLAASEWYAAVSRADPQDARALADYAERRRWHAKLVQTTIAGRLWDALDWRFPEAYRDHFLHWGERTNVDPYLLMGIARRESAYNPEALSPAGARGLMQLMPGTASQLGQRLGVGDPGPYGVLDPELNIRLGSTYMREMLDRYSGNRLAAAAAYNAGPGRVDRWLRDAPQEFDLFVESIPFRETRNYVQAVLSYRVIFESLANGGNSEGVSMLSPMEKAVRYDRSLLASN